MWAYMWARARSWMPALQKGMWYCGIFGAIPPGKSYCTRGRKDEGHDLGKIIGSPEKGDPQPVEKPPGVRGPQCSSQRPRCIGPWGLPGAPLLTGLPPRSSRYWRRSAPPTGGFNRIWRHKVNCPEGTREGPLGGVRQIRKKPCVARVSLHSSLAAP